MVRQRVLVTGAGGFIGRWSLQPLRAAGYEVCAVLSPRRHTVEPEVLPAGIDVRRADLTEPASIDALLEATKPTHLLHFAGVATPGIYAQSSENQRWLSASQHLLAAFGRRGGVRAVMAGSCAEYDWSQAAVCDERSSPLASGAGVSPYAACKIELQRSLEAYGRAHDLSWAWGRIFFQYGPAEHRDRLVASVIANLLAGREAPCTHGRQVRSFLHVADVGAAFAALLASEVRGPVNIGSGDRISIGELLEKLARGIGRPELLKLGARSAPPGEPAVLLPEIGRLRDEVGWHPYWSLDAGLEDAVRWWRARLT